MGLIHCHWLPTAGHLIYFPHIDVWRCGLVHRAVKAVSFHSMDFCEMNYEMIFNVRKEQAIGDL